jgi:hypothetical protein
LSALEAAMPCNTNVRTPFLKCIWDNSFNSKCGEHVWGSLVSVVYTKNYLTNLIWFVFLKHEFYSRWIWNLIYFLRTGTWIKNVYVTKKRRLKT